MTLRYRSYLAESKASLSKDEVVDILAEQPNNADKSREILERWVVSDVFKLTEVYVALNNLGVSQGKTGETRSEGKPIIVDRNDRQVARFAGAFGAAPNFLVLDGQNRVVAARQKSMKGKLKAYVGDKIFANVEAQNKEAQAMFANVEKSIQNFLNSEKPGVYFSELKSYVSRGFLTQDEFDVVRKQWKEKYGGKQ